DAHIHIHLDWWCAGLEYSGALVCIFLQPGHADVGDSAGTICNKDALHIAVIQLITCCDEQTALVKVGHITAATETTQRGLQSYIHAAGREVNRHATTRDVLHRTRKGI